MRTTLWNGIALARVLTAGDASIDDLSTPVMSPAVMSPDAPEAGRTNAEPRPTGRTRTVFLAATTHTGALGGLPGPMPYAPPNRLALA